ncbi:YbfB/YjiJ family MFS transporter [Amycolatopsis sp. DG1A-15b]|uniref:YbfB/YjiJ family MFS transporter n=1 Tax=Amycolatopsis sp. DG1A-15b TaxID=3052846 RepID=UPI00255BD91D|nr:YbfB/YjiJ family MFS transporter [Amycolatopsis sp. DG1A-15b]WIX92176.1 YbfB/YjiJ family MFS transporter [Amycolatopsis sp. DG1A-15b]
MTVTWPAARLALGTASALGLARFAYGLLVPAMRDDLRWTLAEAGAVSTANGLGYLVGAVATAALVRRWGTAAAFRWGMVVTALALAGTAASDVFAVLLAIRAVAGASGAVVFVAGGVIAARAAGRAGSSAPITVYFAGTGLGIVLSGATIPGLADRWQVAWLGLGAVAGLAALACWTAAETGEDRPADARGVARLRPLWRIAVAYFLFAAGYITYITFLSVYLADRHAPVVQVVLTWTVLGAAVMAAPALWSRPITRWPGTRALALVLGALAGGAALALLSGSPAAVIASAIVYGATFMAVPAAVTAHIRTAVPAAGWTATLAAFTTLFATGQTIGPWLGGLLADHASTAAPLAWTAALCAAAAVLAAVPAKPRITSREPSDLDAEIR